ncbi:MAG: glycine cleavage system aminomethyltransferase GcvT, partial [Armatimonadetes bacterium]|nr:glycine cleavage system aminomethyltransferase GcvT [Armatimonadota bacterium]
MKISPLNENHLQMGARMVEFAGWSLPVSYSGILDESLAVRKEAGIFDISHMGRLQLSGAGAFSLLQNITTNQLADLSVGRARYSLIPNPEGGIKDDIIIYRDAPDSFFLVLNASNTDKDIAWFRQHANSSVAFDDLTDRTAMMAVQGPAAVSLLAPLADVDIANLPRFGWVSGNVVGSPARICRTGYTGEDGVELVVKREHAAELWIAINKVGAAPCGLGARDALRIEAGYPLYSHELDEDISPVEARLMWVVDMNKDSFIGQQAIRRVQQEGPRRLLVGIWHAERVVPRQGYTLFNDESVAGAVTSGVYSPVLECGIGMASI